MNYDTITSALFSTTTRTERFTKSHTANASTYALVAAVVLLTVFKAVMGFVAEHLERMPEYRLQMQLTKVRFYRRAVAVAIRVEKFRLSIVTDLSQFTYIVSFVASTLKIRSTSLMDRLFCLR